MKKIYSLFCFTLISGIIAAQPTINWTVLPTAGYTSFFKYVNSATVQPGPSGANQTWNFTSPADSATFSVGWRTPSSTPYASYYPSATLALYTGYNGDTNYAYVNHSTTKTDFVGISFTTGSIHFNFPYSNVEKLFTYPIPYNTPVTDTYSGNYTYNPGILITTYRTGTVTTTADGYGTLITKTATYTNVMRVKFVETQKDSIIYAGIGTTEIVNQFTTTYRWVSATQKDFLMQIAIDSTITTGGTTTQKIAYYKTSTVGIDELTRISFASIYPNPATNELKIQLPETFHEKGVLEITDVQGRIVRSEMIEPTGLIQDIRLNVETFSKGIYLVTVKGESTIITGQFIKE